MNNTFKSCFLSSNNATNVGSISLFESEIESETSPLPPTDEGDFGIIL